MVKVHQMRENKNGGMDYENRNDISRARKVDLITLPKNIAGTNCENCKFVNLFKMFCTHPDILLYVTDRMCCAMWDREGSIREWQK